MEVRIGYKPTRDVRGASVVEDALLELFQRGRAESVPPQPSRRMQKVEVRVVHGDLAAYRHDETRSDDRKIEGLAVVGRARAKRLDLCFEALYELSFRPEVEKHVLPKDELLIGERSEERRVGKECGW